MEYTKQFFESLRRAIDKHPHKCRDCGVADGDRKETRKGDRAKTASVVRLALIDVNGPANRADNVGMYCTRCRPPRAEWRPSRRIKPSELPQLFAESVK